MNRSIRLTSEFALVTGLLLGGGLFLAGAPAATLMTSDPAVSETVLTFLPWAAFYIAVSSAAFQLDGLFIAWTATASMRNASVLSFAAFALALFAWQSDANAGLWRAFCLYVFARAAALLLFVPGELKKLFRPSG